MRSSWLTKGFRVFSIASIALIAAAGSAFALDLTPSTSGVIGANLGSSNCEPGCIYNTFGLTNDGSLSLLYKAEVGTTTSPATVYSGTFASSYTTTFLNTALDPSGATITHVASTTAISCPSCYLAIKDGNHNPSYYFFNLSSWNGTESINLSGFWPRGGAISHVSIWGSGSTGVPEPSALLLMGTALLGLGLWRRKLPVL